MNKGTALLAAALAYSLAAAGTGQAQPIPRLKHDAPYNVVRQTLLRDGWKPVTIAGAHQCPDERCRGYREVFFCAGTGEATCWYSWRRGKTYLMVAGAGEGSPQAFKAAYRCSRIDPAATWWRDMCKQ